MHPSHYLYAVMLMMLAMMMPVMMMVVMIVESHHNIIYSTQLYNMHPLDYLYVCCRLQGESIPEATGNTERTEHRQLTGEVVQDRSSAVY